jgi:hypothetical protein
VAIWTELLALKEPIGIRADFFQAGGYSLLVPRLTWVIKERLGVELSVRTLYGATTVEKLALQIDALALASNVSRAGASPTERFEF